MGAHETKVSVRQKSPSTGQNGSPQNWKRSSPTTRDSGMISKIHKELKKVDIKNEIIQFKNGVQI